MYLKKVGKVAEKPLSQENTGFTSLKPSENPESNSSDS